MGHDAVFLSYASQDAEAAARIRDALRHAGVEVWFDQSELRGGDAWDASIRARIKECALFVPVVSRTTEARGEGYFRLEWKLAVARSHLMADDEAFLLPVVIDDTAEATARVPDAFRERQWTRVGEEGAAGFAGRVKRLLESRGKPAPAALPFEAAAAASDPPPAAPGSRVAVLPFANLSEDRANEYFSDGISEELLTVLQKVPGLHVVARSSSFAFKGSTAAAQEIARKLGVAHLVEGSVRKSGNSVRIAARLVSATTGDQIWSDAYTRALDDVFEVQSALATTIVEELRAYLGGVMSAAARDEVRSQVEAAMRGGTKNALAHELYLQGIYHLPRFSLESARSARRSLERAVAADPGFALAWAALSRAGAQLGGLAEDRLEFDAGWALARDAAERALAIEPDLPSAHVARANLQMGHEFDWRGAIESVRRAELAAPADCEVIQSSALLNMSLGRVAAGLERARQAVACDPLNAQQLALLGYALTTAGLPGEAEATLRRIPEINPGSAWGHAGIALALIVQGRHDEAIEEAAKGGADWSRLTVQSMAHWAAGRIADSDAALAELEAGFADVAAAQIAQVRAYRRENDAAFEWLGRAHRQRDSGLAWIKSDFLLAPLHGDPRWEAFLRGLGLADEQLA